MVLNLFRRLVLFYALLFLLLLGIALIPMTTALTAVEMTAILSVLIPSLSSFLAIVFAFLIFFQESIADDVRDLERTTIAYVLTISGSTYINWQTLLQEVQAGGRYIRQQYEKNLGRTTREREDINNELVQTQRRLKNQVMEHDALLRRRERIGDACMFAVLCVGVPLFLSLADFLYIWEFPTNFNTVIGYFLVYLTAGGFAAAIGMAILALRPSRTVKLEAK